MIEDGYLDSKKDTEMNNHFDYPGASTVAFTLYFLSLFTMHLSEKIFIYDFALGINISSVAFLFVFLLKNIEKR